MSERALADSISAQQGRRGITLLVLLLVLIVSAGLAFRLYRMIDANAVDLLFYDQIELYEAFLDDPSAWDLFRWQHGPHRQGLPFLGTWLLARLTDWNARADAFQVFAYVLVATGLALALRRRLFGPFEATDVAIPLLLLTPAQYGIFLHAPNASHCAGPIVLLLLACHALLIRDRATRYASLAALDFVLVHTGFAIFAGAILPGLLALAAWQDHRAGLRREAAIALAGAVLCLAWIGVFLIDYTGRNGLDAVVRTPTLSSYPRYVAFMFSNVLGLKDPSALAFGVGGGVALAALVVGVASLARLLGWRRPGPDEFVPGPGGRAVAEVDAATPAVVLLLTAFTLLYCAATAVGRIQFGLSGAQSSRYVPLVAPAFLGLYFAVCGLARRPLRLALGAVAIAAIVHASFPMHPMEERFMTQLAQKKRAWVAAYRQSGNVAAASRAARLRIDPFRDPRRSTDETFAWLREHRLSFFADR
ncbi:MAG: hypothetical protein IPK00_19505 [Deltaproteobacteria bacterium]|nr:hypothetical protein [Deltaproteobacteria bacterium]